MKLFELVLLSTSLLVAAPLAACGGSAASIDPDAPRCALPEGCPDGTGSGQGKSAPNPPPTAPISGPRVAISARGSTSPVPHGDPWAGQTPNRQTFAIRSLHLLRGANDSSPAQVFDLGADAVEVELVAGKKTPVASVVAKMLPPGRFTLAKAGIAFVRYSVDARMHTPVAVDGTYENVQALSDGAVIDGTSRAKGFYRYSFVTNGSTLGTLEGGGAPVPALGQSGVVTLDTSGPQSFYVFPVDVFVDPDIAVDHEAVLELNVHESFRWQDQAMPGYTAKVFDTTPSTFEPVMSFGASSAVLTIGPTVD